MKRKFAAAGTGLAAGMMAAAMTMNVFGAQITEDKAKSIALDHAGEKEENLFSVKLEADIENDRQIYEVKLVTRDYREYEYEILPCRKLRLSGLCLPADDPIHHTPS